MQNETVRPSAAFMMIWWALECSEFTWDSVNKNVKNKNNEIKVYGRYLYINVYWNTRIYLHFIK
jgi:hypothetical protein